MKKIVFVTDYVCPYCLVAKRALEGALKELDMKAEIQCQPFELTMEPKERVDTYHDEVRKSHYQVLVEPCKALGIDMKLPPNIVPRPYTRLAFEGRFVAQKYAKEAEYNDLMYCAYFLAEEDIGDIDVLCRLAASLGINEEEFRLALVSGVYKEDQRKLAMYARENMKIRSVPTIFIDGKEIDIHEYSIEEFKSILLGDTIDSDEGFSCGPDGC